MPDITSRTIMVKGPFTADETQRILSVLLPLLQDIEQARPEAAFHFLLDDPNTDIAIDELLAKIPAKPGYERITREIVP